MLELLPLEEAAGWPAGVDDPDVIQDSDIDHQADLQAQDEEAEAQFEAIQDVRGCCGGVDPTCGHYGFHVPDQPYWEEP
jgi:hypothetical protein